MLQTALVEGFEDSGRIAAVGRFGGGNRGDFGLLLEVRAFETVYAGDKPEAVIEAQASLLRLRGGRGVVASKRFRQGVPGASADVDSVVAAFGQAMSAISTDVVGWTLVEGERAVKAAPEESAGR
jgi:cholesterol transport system auxiliary component